MSVPTFIFFYVGNKTLQKVKRKGIKTQVVQSDLLCLLLIVSYEVSR